MSSTPDYSPLKGIRAIIQSAQNKGYIFYLTRKLRGLRAEFHEGRDLANDMNALM